MTVNTDFCLSSFLALRYIYNDEYEFFSNSGYRNKALPKPSKEIFTKQDVDFYINHFVSEAYKKYKKVGLLLSGGIDSAIIASYMKPGSFVYTFISKESSCFDKDYQLASLYANKNKLVHKTIEISFKDYFAYLPGLMINKGCPVSSIEPQLYKAALQAKQDGVDILLHGSSADDVFGGLSKILSKDWSYDEFIDFFSIINPKEILTNYVDIHGAFEPYRQNLNGIDYIKFVKERYSVESYGSFKNPSELSGLLFGDPYEDMFLGIPLDIDRIRSGEPKYILKELYEEIYNGIIVPKKLPLPRPVDLIFKNWKGPHRSEFRTDINLLSLTGNQKWQLWCSEYFLNIIDSYKINEH